MAGVVVTFAGCSDFGERAALSGSGESVDVRVGEIAEVREIRTQIFRREKAPEVGPGRRMVRFFVAVHTTREERRQALVELLRAEAERDSTLVAIRAVMYVPEQTGPQDADLVPVAWAEWLPPRGWVMADSMAADRQHMIYTYMDSPPQW